SGPLADGLLIESSPVIVMPGFQKELLDQTRLHDYIFLWGTDSASCCVALGYLSLYNHSYTSNAEYEMDFSAETIRIRTVRAIREGEEICINYNGVWNDPKPVWFDVTEP